MIYEVNSAAAKERSLFESLKALRFFLTRWECKQNTQLIHHILSFSLRSFSRQWNRLIFLNHECHNFFIHSRIYASSFYFLFVTKKKAQTHNGITMKRVRHVISFTFNRGKKERKRMKDIRRRRKVNKLNAKGRFSLLRLIYNSQSLVPFAFKKSFTMKLQLVDCTRSSVFLKDQTGTLTGFLISVYILISWNFFFPFPRFC